MATELWDLTDRAGERIGPTHVRAEPVSAGVFHIVASVCAVRELRRTT
ncbi:MAG: hypothetical protein ACTIH8_02940 [Microbacterium gubbeenense]